METIKNTLTQLMESLHRKKERAAAGNPEEWLKKVLTPQESKHAQYHYCKKGILCIKVDSSSWLYYFNLHKVRLLEALCQESGEIKHIRFCIGELTK